MKPQLKNQILWISAVLFVLLIFQVTYGLKTVLPTNVSWLMTVMDDWGQHYLGWFFFRQEPWHFPLGHIDNLYYPLGTNVGFTDSIPLLCIFFKLFAPILPADFQFLGGWLLLCHLLAAYYTIKLMQLFKVGRAITLMAVIIVAANPVLVYRGMHPALCAHWLFIASFYLYFKVPTPENVKKILLHQFILLMIAVLVNPYIGFMTGGLSLVNLVKITFFDKAITPKKFVGFIGLALFSVILAWWLVGFIEFHKKEDLGVSGAYGLYALNLNSLYNAHDFSTYLPNFGQVSWHQFESFMYLGLGMIAILFFLLIVFLVRRFRRPVADSPAPPASGRKARFRLQDGTSLVPLLVFMILVMLFSITQVVTLNEKVLFRIPAPRFLTDLGDVFRASARFFWMPYYLILLFSIIAVAKLKIKQLGRTAIILLALLLQVRDTYPILVQRHPTYGSYDPPIDKRWSSLIGPFNDLIFYPPFESHQLTHMDYQYFCYLAAQHRKAINIGYVARSDGRAMQAYGDSLGNSLDDGNPLSPGTLYITTKPFLDHFTQQLQTGSAVLNTVDGYYYLYSSGLKNDSLQRLSAMLNAENKAHLDSGLTIAGQKQEFAATGKAAVPGDKPIHYYITRLNNGANTLSLEGWAFLDTANNDKGDSLYINLGSAERNYIVPAHIQKRPDVSAHFSKPYLDDAGFKLIAFFDSVEKGEYNLGLSIHDHLGRWIFQATDHSINVRMPEFAKPEKMTERPEDGKIIYGLEFVKSDVQSISIRGWAAIEGQDAVDSRISWVFKNGTDIYVVDAESFARPDVTAAFKNKYNLDHSGFKGKILKNSLPAGKYQVGILIRDARNHKENLVFTEKQVDIP